MQATDDPVRGLAKIVHSSAAAHNPRVKLDEEFIRCDLDDAARRTLLPVARDVRNAKNGRPLPLLVSQGRETEAGS
jgi:hypothetical protein